MPVFRKTNIFELEKIIDYADGLYLIKWKGWAQKYNTWEPPQHLHTSIIEEYHINVSNQKNIKKNENIKQKQLKQTTIKEYFCKDTKSSLEKNNSVFALLQSHQQINNNQQKNDDKNTNILDSSYLQKIHQQKQCFEHSHAQYKKQTQQKLNQQKNIFNNQIENKQTILCRNNLMIERSKQKNYERKLHAKNIFIIQKNSRNLCQNLNKKCLKKDKNQKIQIKKQKTNSISKQLFPNDIILQMHMNQKLNQITKTSNQINNIIPNFYLNQLKNPTLFQNIENNKQSEYLDLNSNNQKEKNNQKNFDSKFLFENNVQTQLLNDLKDQKYQLIIKEKKLVVQKTIQQINKKQFQSNIFEQIQYTQKLQQSIFLQHKKYIQCQKEVIHIQQKIKKQIPITFDEFEIMIPLIKYQKRKSQNVFSQKKIQFKNKRQKKNQIFQFNIDLKNKKKIQNRFSQRLNQPLFNQYIQKDLQIKSVLNLNQVLLCEDISDAKIKLFDSNCFCKVFCNDEYNIIYIQDICKLNSQWIRRFFDAYI